MRKAILHTSAILGIVFATSCGNTTESVPTGDAAAGPEARTLDAAQWLAGRWEAQIPGGTLFEQWAQDGQEMKGTGGMVKGTDTMVTETMVIKIQDTNILYIPTVKGQNNDQPVTFTHTILAADSMVFANPAHDFPQLICYKKMGDTAMEARISGKINGKETAEGFVLHKTR